MELKEKRRCKKRAKIYRILAWASAAIGFITLFGTIAVISKHRLNIPVTTLAQTLVVILPFFILFLAAMAFNMNAQAYLNKLRSWRLDIQKYRQRRIFHMIIGFVKSGQIKEAANMYDKFKHELRAADFLYAFLANELRHSSEEHVRLKGEALLDKELDRYNPNKVFDMKFTYLKPKKK